MTERLHRTAAGSMTASPPPPREAEGCGGPLGWRRGLLFLLAYILATLVRLHPLVFRFNSHFLGVPERDLFDEMWMQKAVLGTVLEGRWFWTPLMDYPSGLDLAASHLSYLHILFTAPLPLCMPWPAWWNAVNVVALACSALAAAWATWRLSGHLVSSFLAGLVLIGLPWVAFEANAGHLNQLWMAPMFVAVGYLYQALEDPHDRHAWWLLALWTVVTSQVYWIYGFMVAMLGGVLVLCRLPVLHRTTLARLTLAVLLTLAALLPLAWKVYDTRSPPEAYRHTGINSRANAVARALENSLELGSAGSPRQFSQRPLCLAAAPWLPPGLALLGLVLLGLEWRYRTGFLPWFLAAALLLTLALGPHLLWQGRILADGQGLPVAMPFLLLQDQCHLLYRWSLPLKTIPLAFFCLCQGTVLLALRLARLGRPRSLVAWGLLGGLLLVGLELGPEKNLQIALTPARIPHFSRFLAHQPEGAVVDLPLGYVENVWQLQIHHDHPKIQGLAMEPLLLNLNPFLQELAAWNHMVLPPGVRLHPRSADSEAFFLDYGTRRLPRKTGQVSGPSAVLRLPPLPSQVRKGYREGWDLGLRYVVLHRANCFWVDPRHGQEVYQGLRDLAQARFGEPAFEDGEAAVFRLPPPPPLPQKSGTRSDPSRTSKFGFGRPSSAKPAPFPENRSTPAARDVSDTYIPPGRGGR